MTEQNASEINWPTPQEWAAELRTTKKGQTRRVLRTPSNHANCCLGILAEMTGAEPSGLTEFQIGGVHVDPSMSDPWGPHPAWMTSSIGLYAARLNDHEGKTFAEIADWIDDGMEVPS